MTKLTPLAVRNGDVLRAMAEKDFPTAARLAKHVGRDPDNLRKTLKALQAAGLVSDLVITADGRDMVDALARAEGAAAANGVRDAGELPFLLLRHDQISPDPENARKHFDPEGIAELAETMFTHGLKQKPSVRRDMVDGRHPLTMGERRWRAWGLLIEQGRWSADHVEPCWIDQVAEGHLKGATVNAKIQELQGQADDEAETPGYLRRLAGCRTDAEARA